MMPSFNSTEAGDGEARYQFLPQMMDPFGSTPMSVGQLNNGTQARPEAWAMSGIGNKADDYVDGNERRTNKPLAVFVPLFGRLRFLRDPYGIASLLFIVFYWMYGTGSTLAVVLIPQYREGRVMAPLIGFYIFIAILCLATLFKAATTNPGMVPFPVEERPVTSDPSVGYCEKCHRRKPARAHHCSRCHQCVQRMDHHCQCNSLHRTKRQSLQELMTPCSTQSSCGRAVSMAMMDTTSCPMNHVPLPVSRNILTVCDCMGTIKNMINNCVGEGNHYLFLILIFYTFALSFLTLALGCMQLFYFSPCRKCSKDSLVTRHGEALVIGSTLMGGLMAMSSMGLLISQTISLMLDQTTIEIMQISHDWMIKGPRATQNMPKPKSCMEAFRELCGLRPLWMWLFPCGRRLPQQPADPYAV